MIRVRICTHTERVFVDDYDLLWIVKKSIYCSHFVLSSFFIYLHLLASLYIIEGVYFQHRLYRESCLAVEGNYLKDLNVLGRDLTKTVLVDNSPHAFGYQVDNGIPIESWFDDPNDTELLKLERFLRTLNDFEDVRLAVRAKFQTYLSIEEA